MFIHQFLFLTVTCLLHACSSYDTSDPNIKCFPGNRPGRANCKRYASRFRSCPDCRYPIIFGCKAHSCTLFCISLPRWISAYGKIIYESDSILDVNEGHVEKISGNCAVSSPISILFHLAVQSRGLLTDIRCYNNANPTCPLGDGWQALWPSIVSWTNSVTLFWDKWRARRRVLTSKICLLCRTRQTIEAGFAKMLSHCHENVCSGSPSSSIRASIISSS
jgi:hypothetical protein